MEQKFDLEDITLVPATLSIIRSRSEISTHYGNGTLPLIAAPMDSVINDTSVVEFVKRGILTCSIRRPKLDLKDLNLINYDFIGVSLEQFQEILDKPELVQAVLPFRQGILIDIANGHMIDLFEMVQKYKTIFKNPIMVGNIANPKTYGKYCEILDCHDYVRLSIGSGSACLTGANLGVYYPMGSLIDECYTISATMSSAPKIVADGGFRNFDDIIKALNLGADYVMLGGIFAKTLEACGDTYFKGIKVTKYKNLLFKHGFKLYRKYRGMSTKEVQKSFGKKFLTTSEGISFKTPVQYTLSAWTKNFTDYLKSAMSYCGCRGINCFIGERTFIHITPNAIKRYKK
jgi:GMP reductase